MRRITREELRNKLILKEEIKLIEALPLKYWKNAHIPGAIQMDYKEIFDKAATLLPNKEEEIIVYCASEQCQNSTIAARELRELGYLNVQEYFEGKDHWIEAGLPVLAAQ